MMPTKIKLIALFTLYVFNSAFAISKRDSLLSVINQNVHDTVKCVSYLSLGDIYKLNNPDSTLYFYEKANLIATNNIDNASPELKKRYIHFSAYALYNLGSHEIGKSNLSTALKYYTEALSKFESINEQEGKANCLNDIGYIYYCQGNISVTLEYYNKALKIYESIQYKDGIVASYVNTAAIYADQGDYKRALSCYEKAIVIIRELNDLNMLAVCNNNIALIYIQRGEYLCENNDVVCDSINKVKALKYLSECLKIYEKLHDKSGMTTTYNNIGLVYYKQKMIEEAHRSFKQAYTLAAELKSKRIMAYAALNLADVFLYKGNTDSALEYANLSMQLAREIGYPEVIKNAAAILKKTYLRQNNYKMALEMSELTVLMSDSLKNEANKKNNVKKLMEINFQKKSFADSLQAQKDKELLNLQLDKQNNQKIFLSIILALSILFGIFMYQRLQISAKQKAEIEEKNILVQKSLLEKEILLKEIHHRVKNNLQVVSSLLGLQSKSINDEDVKKVFEESKNKINAISLIHQKLYQSTNLAEIDMEEYFEGMYTSIASLFQSAGTNITFEVAANDIRFDIDTSVPLGLIFNELTTNSLKYAFKDATEGYIRLHLQQVKAGVFSFVFEDNGCGFNKSAVNPKSLGLNLVKMLTTQLNGSISIESEKGTKISIIFENTLTRKLTE